MKKIKSYWKSTARAGSAAALFAFLTFPTALAAPPEGKGGGKGGNNEEPPPVPFRYQVTWIEADPADGLRMRDVSPDGTVVGAIIPGNVYGSNIAYVSFPDGTSLNVEELLKQNGVIGEAWRATLVYRICDGGLMAVDVYDDAGQMYCGALQLNADRSFGSFTLFGDPDGEDAILMDASEAGQFLIATAEFTDGPIGVTFGGPADLHVWSPATGTSLLVKSNAPGGRYGWWASSISDYPAAVWEKSFLPYESPTGVISLPDPDTAVELLDVGDDGTVVARVAGAQIRRNKSEPSVLARWNPGNPDAPWEPLVEGRNGLGEARVNKAGEIVMSADYDLLVLQDDFTAPIRIDDMIDPDDPESESWNPDNSVFLHGHSDPVDATAPGGLILGEDITADPNRFFILTPVALPDSQP
jgi:hypothetical protein